MFKFCKKCGQIRQFLPNRMIDQKFYNPSKIFDEIRQCDICGVDE